MLCFLDLRRIPLANTIIPKDLRGKGEGIDYEILHTYLVIPVLLHSLHSARMHEDRIWNRVARSVRFEVRTDH